MTKRPKLSLQSSDGEPIISWWNIEIFYTYIIVLIIALITFGFICFAEAKQIRVAVIDTGIKPNNQVKLCNKGHKDFTGTSLNDIDGHGNNISHIIENYAKDTDYCQVIIKFYVKYDIFNQIHLIQSLKHAIDENVNVINISGGGIYPDKEEKKLIEIALNKGIIIVAASGNEGQNLDLNCSYFPACYDPKIIVVGNILNNYSRSNYGENVVDAVENGVEVNAGGSKLTGSSQATAIVTGKLIKKLYINRFKK